MLRCRSLWIVKRRTDIYDVMGISRLAGRTGFATPEANVYSAYGSAEAELIAHFPAGEK